MSCGKSCAGRKIGVGPGHRRRGHRGWHGHRHDGFFGADVEKMGPGAQVVAALSVLAPVALSGLALVVFVPGLWWIFTTYFWVAFPAVGLLTRGLAGLGEARTARLSPESRERELLGALRDRGELTPAGAAVETSLSVAEADEMLKKLATAGHLEVRVSGGGIFYALWETGAPTASEVPPTGEEGAT